MDGWDGMGWDGMGMGWDGMGSLLHQGLSEPEFYGDLVYTF